MKQRHLAALAAFLVGAMGGAAFGDDHGGGPIEVPLENCSNYPWWCWGQCAELNTCRSGNTPIGGSNCAIEEANLASCETSQPPYVPPGIIVPPPACPAGQHRHDSGCHADHVCGDDEIGGGGEECQPCGAGQIPNPAGTACSTCPYGESSSGGTCNADPCGLHETDNAATTELWAYRQREPFERGLGLVCQNNTIQHTSASWVRSTASDACAITITFPSTNESCWSGHARPDPCNLASIHTHPYFTEADRGATCGLFTINSRGLAMAANDGGMDFSPNDNSLDFADGVDGYLGVSDRSCVKANRRTSGFPAEVVAGSCTSTPLPHVPWSTP